MSMLSEKLKEIIQKKQIKMYTLANLCNIDRAALYKYVNGDRKISMEVFRQLAEGLRLSPEERAELTACFNIADMGEEEYLRRSCTAEFLSSFRVAPAEQPVSKALPGPGPKGALYGSLEINHAVQAAVRAEMERNNGEVLLMAQPEYESLFQALPALALEKGNCTIRHILCLEGTEKSGDNRYNLRCLRAAMQAAGSGCTYVPYYYYDNVHAHFSNNNLLPCLVVTGGCAIQISSRAEYALCHREKEQVAFFQKLFAEAVKKSQPLCGKIHTLAENLPFDEQMTLNREPPRYCISAEPCLIPCLSRDMLERSVNWHLPGAGAVVDQLMEYIRGQNGERGGRSVQIDYFTLEGLDYFCNTGRIWQIPEFDCAPLPARDRHELLRRYSTMWSDSRVHLMLRPEIPRVSVGLEAVVCRGGAVCLIQEHHPNAYAAFLLCEKSLSYCFKDLLSSLEKSGGAYTQEETRAVLQQKM
ncbi:helix-turn-helix transcriptional regulator, partial [Blautia wexlerae]|nr:helix-turn-helix transcriptional regulator [Blautia wexlerae]